RAVGAPAPGAKTPSRMQKGAGPVRTEAVLLHVRNRYVPGAYGVARVRCTPQLVLVPPRASPHRRSTRPGCENALPDAERCWPRSHRGGAPTRTKPLRSGCIWRSAGALHPALRTSWCSSLPGDHRAVGAPAPGAKTPSRMQKGADPVRTEAVLLHVRNRYVPGAYGVAPVRCTPHCGRAGARPSLGITAL